MRYLLHTLILFSLPLHAATAAEPCSPQPSDAVTAITSALAAQPTTRVDKEGTDVQTYAAAELPTDVQVGQTADAIPLADCVETDRRPRFSNGVHLYDYVDLDCGEALKNELGSPILGRTAITVPVQTGSLNLINSSVADSGKLVEIYVVTPTDFVQPGRSKGIGFSYRGGEHFVPVSELSDATDVTLADGRAAKMYKFSAVHWGGPFENIGFKPYMRWDANGTEYRVYEDVSAQAGTDHWTGAPFGSGNYLLRLNQSGRFVNDGLIQETDVLDWPAPEVPLGPLNHDHRNVDVTTLTVRNGVSDYEMALEPYVSSYPLKMDPESRFVEAGQDLWFRVSDPSLDGKPVKVFYSVDGGAEQQAQGLLGGNCYGPFQGCFQLEVPEGKKLSYRIVSEEPGGQQVEYSSADIPVVSADQTVTIGAGDTSAQVSGPFKVEYDPGRALKLAAQQVGHPPQTVIMSAEVSLDGGAPSTYPLGVITSYQPNGNIAYNSNVLRLPIDPSGASSVSVTVKAKAMVNGQDEGTFADEPFVVSIP